MRWLLVVLPFLLAPQIVATAHADAVVTQCTNDRGGSGDLASAIQVGGLITFQCPAGSTIQMSGGHSINTNVTIDGGNNVTLTGGAQAFFLAQNDGLILELDNLTFRNTTQPIVRQLGATTVIVAGSTFLNCIAPLSTPSAELLIKRSIFTNNTGTVVSALSHLTIQFSQFRGTKGIAVFSGGADTTTRISDSQFIQNSAGGVMVGLGNSTAYNTTFELARSDFTQNGGDKTNPNGNIFGGVLYICNDQAKNCSLKIVNATFTGNRWDNGAALSVSGAALVTISGSKFEKNIANNEGGAIVFEPRNVQNAKIQIDYSVFRGNTAREGGAIFISLVHFQGRAVTFSKNASTENGGAISARNSQILLGRAVFVDNTSGGRGGAIAMQGGNSNVVANTLFVRTKTAGGGAFVGADTRFINVTFADNTGSAILMDSSQSPPWGSKPIALKNVILTNNSGGNCQFVGGGTRALVKDEGHNIEFQTISCADRAKVANPYLDALYLPVAGSPAMANGDNPTCMADPVGARDVYGKRRPQVVVCSIGAAEGDLEKEVADQTGGAGTWPNNGPANPPVPPTSSPPANTCCCCR